jgi:cation transport regulator ChaC
MWYFAYGSNLWAAQMTARTGVSDTDRPRRVRLPGYRLAFDMSDGRGQAFANIARPGDRVLGVLYWCDWRALDSLDGSEVGYRRVRVEVRDESDTRLEAVAYAGRPWTVSAAGRPAAEYVRRIVLGAREHGLPEPYILAVEAAAGIGNR